MAESHISTILLMKNNKKLLTTLTLNEPLCEILRLAYTNSQVGVLEYET